MPKLINEVQMELEQKQASIESTEKEIAEKIEIIRKCNQRLDDPKRDKKQDAEIRRQLNVQQGECKNLQNKLIELNNDVLSLNFEISDIEYKYTQPPTEKNGVNTRAFPAIDMSPTGEKKFDNQVEDPDDDAKRDNSAAEEGQAQTGKLAVTPLPQGAEKVDLAEAVNADGTKFSPVGNPEAFKHPQVLKDLVSLFEKGNFKRVSLENINLSGEQLEPLLKALAKHPLVYLNLSGNNIGQDDASGNHPAMQDLGELVLAAYETTTQQLEIVLNQTTFSLAAMKVFCECIEKHGIFPKLDLHDATISDDAMKLLLTAANSANVVAKKNKYLYLEFPHRESPHSALSDDNAKLLGDILSFDDFYYSFDDRELSKESVGHILAHMNKCGSKAYAVFGYIALCVYLENVDAFNEAIQKPRVLSFGVNLKKLDTARVLTVLEAIKKATHISFPGFTNLFIDGENLAVLCGIFRDKKLTAISIGLKGSLVIDELFDAIRANQQFSNLQLIEVFGDKCSIGPVAFGELANAKGSSVRKLKLNGLNVTDKYLLENAEALAKNYPRLTVLDLSDNHVTQSGVTAVRHQFEKVNRLVKIKINGKELNLQNVSVPQVSASFFYQSVKKQRVLYLPGKDCTINDLQKRLNDAPNRQEITQLHINNHSTFLAATAPKITQENYNLLADIIRKLPTLFEMLTHLHLDGIILDDQYISPVLIAIREILPKLNDFSLEGYPTLSR
jgi:hypothetical protein